MKIAEKLGDKLRLQHLTGLAALLHDLGKFDSKFQEYLRAAFTNPGSVKRGSVDHSTGGGRLLYQNLHINVNNNSVEKLTAEIVGNAIISHHSSQGLQDMLAPDLESDYLQRIEEKVLDNFDKVCECFFAEVMSEEKFMEYVQQAIKELETYLIKNKETVFTYNLFFMNKFIYSCLIDADRINTMLFEDAKELAPNINSNELFSGYYDKLINHLAGFNRGKTAVSRINRLREEMSKQCDAFAENDTGMYKLSIPTGGGKTLASLRFALKHAKEKGKDRIIYIVPYTTVIEQNAKTVRDILNDDENILEHHSNIIEDWDKKSVGEQNSENLNNYSTEKTIRLTKDNWESSIIFTTMVQFLEVIYGSGTRRVRRFHNLANAVIIFDEVQTVPLKCVSMFNEALNYLKDCMNSTLVLCTATQPALNDVEKKLNIAPGAEMIKNIPEVIEAFKRTKIIDTIEPGGWSVEQLTDFIKEKIDVKRSILAVLNTTSAVRKTFCLLQQEMGKEINLYHLSTMMCPAHRKVILAEIRGKLKNGEKVLCISTQLIEAGVDISFECVIRSLAGCDSIAQAAGRCNRNGEKAIQEVYIVKLNSKVESLTRLKEIKRGQDVTMEILNAMALGPNLFWR
ncbi:MAG: CRISPR-associated helicase Cas3' [Acidaminococcaceae bacterium]